MDFLVQQMQRIAQERADMEARGETPPPLPDFLDPDKMMDDATDWVKDQFLTKEEKEAKSKKKRDEIEERERKEREAAAPSLADMFSGFKFGSGRSPFYHMQGGMINPFDKDGKLLPQFQRDPMVDDSMFHPVFDFIENERRTTNPFYHLQGAGQVEDFLDAVGKSDYAKDKITKGAISGVQYLGSKLLDHLLGGGKMPDQLVGGDIEDFFTDFFADIAKDGIKKGMEMVKKLRGSGWEDDLNAFVGEQLGKLLLGGIAHNPKGHTTRNNNLTKQKPQKKKFCGFKSKVFEHEDYDPASMHKFRSATCGGKPLPKGGRPSGAKNKEGYVRSGEFTEGVKRYGQTRQFRGQGKQMQQFPDDDELVSKKENPMVDKIIHEPMDDGDIRAYFPRARVLRYADLADYDTIEELLPAEKSHVFLLYQHRPNDGHFVCVMRYAKTIEFFCSYGSKIDAPLKWTSLPERVALGEGKPYLSMLLRKAASKFKAIHNPVAFQSKREGVATCGAYCVVRINQLVNHNQDLHEFIDYMEEVKKDTDLSYDEIVANYVQKR